MGRQWGDNGVTMGQQWGGNGTPHDKPPPPPPHNSPALRVWSRTPSSSGPTARAAHGGPPAMGRGAMGQRGALCGAGRFGAGRCAVGQKRRVGPGVAGRGAMGQRSTVWGGLLWGGAGGLGGPGAMGQRAMGRGSMGQKRVTNTFMQPPRRDIGSRTGETGRTDVRTGKDGRTDVGTDGRVGETDGHGDGWTGTDGDRRTRTGGRTDVGTDGHAGGAGRMWRRMDGDTGGG